MKKYVSAAALRAPLVMALLVCALSTVASAQPVTAPWTASDIGAPTLSGNATQPSASALSIDAAGVDVWGASDQFHFVYQPIAGDVEIVARVDSLTATNPFANAGVMIRASLNANAAHAYAASTSANGVYLRRRLAAGATSSSVAGAKVAAPVWVRAVRSGTLVTAYSSTNGTTWTTIGSVTLPLGTTAYVGVATTSHDATIRTTARISNLKVTKAAALPAGQQSRDIGAPAVAGSTTYASGQYTVKAAGKDIWDVADQFHFVYQQVTGDVQIVARVASIVNTYTWAKAGVMVRESLAADARHALMAVSAASGNAFQRRPTPAAYSVNTSGGAGTAPGWVKLVRTGDLFEASRSADGVTWTRVSSDTIPMGDTVYVGLAVTSHNVSTATTAVIDNLKITAATAPANQSPAVSLTAPVNGTQVTAPATVSLTATASDPENRMASVDFYAGSTLIARDTTAPYSASWAASAAGTYALTAVAYDADGGSSTSSAVSVTVAAAANKPPTISLSTGGTTFTAPATITLAATASDPEGQLARVEFFNGATRLATDTTAPYSYAWTGVAAGTYTVTAIAYDAAGASATTAAATITVTGTTTVTPPKTLVFTAAADHATNVTSYVLKIFASGANPATATPIATSDLGKPAPAANNDITVDRATFFSALAAGSYLATVTSVGPGGQTPSVSVAFTR